MKPKNNYLMSCCSEMNENKQKHTLWYYWTTWGWAEGTNVSPNGKRTSNPEHSTLNIYHYVIF
jgi:hypothetical protein